jgi:hypothetical protein
MLLGPPLPLLFRFDPGSAPAVREADEKPPGRRRIRCPRCAWEPAREDVWMCSCLHVWNTFDTHGLCPGCGRQWLDTKCPRCRAWSPHDDWYEEE